MWKKIEFAIVLLLLAVLIMMSNHLEEMVSSGRVTGRNPCIVLDSGHGGEDPGKIGVNQAKEKDVNLKIAKKTKERLEKKGWKVVMTREKDVMLGDPAAGNKKIHDMKARVERINKTMPQAAVSIHQNSYQDAQIHGAQVFYYSHSEEGKRMAEVMQKALLKADEENAVVGGGSFGNGENPPRTKPSPVWICASMRPGITTFPDASITRCADQS